jgi:hypothetical protein
MTECGAAVMGPASENLHKKRHMRCSKLQPMRSSRRRGRACWGARSQPGVGIGPEARIPV